MLELNVVSQDTVAYGRDRDEKPDLATLVDANTVLIAASAPQYPHGVVDPIEEIGRLAAIEQHPEPRADAGIDQCARGDADDRGQYEAVEAHAEQARHDVHQPEGKDGQQAQEQE